MPAMAQLLCLRPAVATALAVVALASEMGLTLAAAPGTVRQERRSIVGRHRAIAALHSCAQEGNLALSVDGLSSWLECSMGDGSQALGTEHAEFVRNNSALALRARREVPVAESVPEDIFRRDVLPYRNLDEPVESGWRSEFLKRLGPIASKASSLQAAAEEVIPRVWTDLGKKVEFKSDQTPQIMSPSQVLEHGYGSCTGLSIFLVDALRSVGIPARIAGIARWNRAEGGNHNWVEVWTGPEKQWRFVDAVPATSVVWDRTWFTDGTVQKSEPRTTTGVYTVVADPAEADGKYEITWRDPPKQVPALDRTEFYKSLPPNA